MRLSGLFGFLLLAIILGGDVAVADDIFAFVYLPALLVTVFGALALSYLSYGALATLRALRSLTWLILTPPENESLGGLVRVLRGNLVHLYASGAVGTFIGLIKMLDFHGRTMDSSWQASPILVTLLPLFYALLLSECLVRPAARRIRGLVAD